MTKEELIVAYFTSIDIPCYSLEKPKGVNQCVVYMQISHKVFRSHSGVLGSRDRYLITFYASSYGDLVAMVNNFTDGVDGNQTNFELVTVENSKDKPKQIDVNLYSKDVEIFVW